MFCFISSCLVHPNHIPLIFILFQFLPISLNPIPYHPIQSIPIPILFSSILPHAIQTHFHSVLNEIIKHIYLICTHPQNAARKRKFTVIVVEGAPFYQVCMNIYYTVYSPIDLWATINIRVQWQPCSKSGTIQSFLKLKKRFDFLKKPTTWLTWNSFKLIVVFNFMSSVPGVGKEFSSSRYWHYSHHRFCSICNYVKSK